MKYDFSKCNNLQFRAKDEDGKVREGFLKVANCGMVYLYYSDKRPYFNPDLQFEYPLQTKMFSNTTCFGVWAENHDMEIIPRDPETYTDWKVGDKVKHNINNQVYTILAVLGEAIILSKDSGLSITALTTAEALTKYNKLVLTDYEKELIHAQEQEENKKKKCPFKEGDKVLVRDEDTSWDFDTFLSYDAESSYPYDCVSNPFQQCIPLNERTWKLLGTTDEYKEEE